MVSARHSSAPLTGVLVVLRCVHDHVGRGCPRGGANQPRAAQGRPPLVAGCKAVLDCCLKGLALVIERAKTAEDVEGSQKALLYLPCKSSTGWPLGQI